MGKLPENLLIEYVIGPLKIKKCGNSGHVLVPCKFIGRETAYIIICRDSE